MPAVSSPGRYVDKILKVEPGWRTESVARFSVRLAFLSPRPPTKRFYGTGMLVDYNKGGLRFNYEVNRLRLHGIIFRQHSSSELLDLFSGSGFFLYNPDITSFFLLLNHFFISEKE